jgi:hypothetical protein
MIFCVGVVYSGKYDACDVTLSVYPHQASLKNMPGHGGNRTCDLWNTSPIVNGLFTTYYKVAQQNKLFQQQSCPVNQFVNKL